MFINGLQLAWDRGYNENTQFLDCIYKLKKVGYPLSNIQVFMLCNGKVPFEECMSKLKTLSIMGIQVCDCWYDNQKRGSVKPEFSWTKEQCIIFGQVCRAHNISVQQNQIKPLKMLFNWVVNHRQNEKREV